MDSTAQTSDRRDRLAGTLLGTALGDALGLPCEGMSARSITRRFGRVNRFRLLGETGFVSDDTEQAALVAQALARHPDDVEACVRAFRRSLLGWFCRLPWGVGMATVRSCLRIGFGLSPSGVMSAGNGAAMRAAVIGGWYPLQMCREDASRRGVPMTERLRGFIARHVFHPLQGMSFGDWWTLLQRHRSGIGPRHWFRALVQTAASAANSAAARLERRRFGGRIDVSEVRPPLVILGHYRSGTTHLHNLLALDPRFSAPTLFQAFNPHTFLTNERLAAPLADRLLIRRRFQDEMALGAGLPAEDEVALGAMTGLSPYLAWYFPRDAARYDRYLTFRDVEAGEVARWGHALTIFLKKLTLRYGRPLVLKSPPHTARIRLLMGLFPDARFVHIRRHPYEVFRSTRHMIRSVHPLFRLQDGPPPDGDDQILGIYTEMYDAYFEERGLIPRGQLCEVGYEDLERDPLAVVKSTYESLGLAGFEQVRPRLEGYLASIAGYRKNRLDDLPQPLRQRIARVWGRSFDEWGYVR